MKEKLETLPLAQLRQIGRDLGIRNVTGQRKAELIGNILEAGKEREEKAKPARTVRQEETRSQQGRQQSVKNLNQSDPGGNARWLRLHPLRKLYAGRRRCLRIALSDPAV